MKRKNLAAALVIGALAAGAGAAETQKVTVSNELDDAVKISVDGQVICEVAAKSECAADVPAGAHVVRAERSDGGYTEAQIDNPAKISVGENGIAAN